jgi:hypothetical protein
METGIKDTYFRRFLVPIVIAILVFCLIAVIITTPPGAPVVWETFATAMGGLPKQLGAGRR